MNKVAKVTLLSGLTAGFLGLSTQGANAADMFVFDTTLPSATTTTVIESPVMVDRVVTSPVVIDSTPTTIVRESPVIIKDRDRSLLHLGIFPLLDISLF
ncbi:MAG TPA: hypothetical protein V6D17_00990 [Candidatus Obscuribacterales bacterium]